MKLTSYIEGFSKRKVEICNMLKSLRGNCVCLGFFCRTFDYNKKYLMMLTFIYLKNKLEGLRSVFLVIIRYQNQNPICIWKKWVHFEFPFFNFKYFQEKFVWISIHVKKEKKVSWYTCAFAMEKSVQRGFQISILKDFLIILYSLTCKLLYLSKNM